MPSSVLTFCPSQYERETKCSWKIVVRYSKCLNVGCKRKNIFASLFSVSSNLSQPQQLTQATDIQEEEIKMSLNLPYVKGISEKLQCILRSHTLKSTFYTKNTLCKLLCKSKDRVATEDKNNIIYQIDCSNCEAVYFFESKWSLKSQNRKDLSGIAIVVRVKLQNTVGKQITTLAGITRRLLTGQHVNS